MNALLALVLTAGEPVLLAEDVFMAAPVSPGIVLCASEDGGFFTIDIPGGARRPWAPDRLPEDDGWVPYDLVPVLVSSPDGGWVAWVRCAGLPEEYEIEWEGMRSVGLVYVSRPDGSGARPVAVTWLVGGGPYFDFTSDSRYLVGSPIAPCAPDPEAYARSVGDQEGGSAGFTHYEVATGRRILVEDLPLGDGYWKCPYSEYFRIENNWYAEHGFSSFDTGGVLGRWVVPGGECRLWGWATEDAMLYSIDGGCGLVYVDGSVTEAPSCGWELYCLMPDGNSLYSSDSGRTVRFGWVDWVTFEEHRTEEVQGLAGFPGLGGMRIIPMPDSRGVLFSDGWNTGELWLLPLY